MVDDELTPAETGSVRKVGTADGGSIISRMVDDIKRHGEVHANFEHVDGGVECRLGTTRVNHIDGVVEVFDGDQYRPFNMDKLVDWEVPMGVFHG